MRTRTPIVTLIAATLAALILAAGCGPEPGDTDTDSSSDSDTTAASSSSGDSMSSGPGSDSGASSGSGDATTGPDSGLDSSSGDLDDTTGDGGGSGSGEGGEDSTGATEPGDTQCVGEPCGGVLPHCQRGSQCVKPDPDLPPRCFATCDPMDARSCQGSPALCDVIVAGQDFCQPTAAPTCN